MPFIYITMVSQYLSNGSSHVKTKHRFGISVKNPISLHGNFIKWIEQELFKLRALFKNKSFSYDFKMSSVWKREKTNGILTHVGHSICWVEKTAHVNW